MTLQRSGLPPSDVVATVDARATIGDLADHLAAAAPGGRGFAATAGPLTLALVDRDTRTLDRRSPVAESGLRSGSAVTLTPSGASYRDPAAGAVAVVTVVDGPDLGREFPLTGATSIIGRERGCDVRLSDPLVSRQHARITVSDVVEIVDLGSANGLTLDGASVTRTVLRGADTVRLGDTALTVRAVQAVRTASGAVEGSSVAFIRPPRLDPTWAGLTLTAPEPPERPNKQRFPLVSLLAPLVMGALLYLITKSPTSLIFVALSPLMLIGNAVEGRVSGRSTYKKALAGWRADLAGLVSDATEANVREADARRAEHPSISQSVHAGVTRSELLWTRRPDDRGFVEIRLGVGSLPARNTIEVPDGRRTPREVQRELQDAVASFAVVHDVPVVGRPASSGGTGIAGPRPAMLGVARAVVAQIAALHSPAEVTIAGIVSSRTAPDWDWIKWLPHTGSAHNPLPLRPLASTAPVGAALLSELESLVASRREDDTLTPSVVVLVEGDAPVEHARLVELAETGWHHGVHVVWLASEVANLPAACRTFVAVDHDGRTATAGWVEDGVAVAPVSVDTLDAAAALDLARRLAPVVDIGARVEDDSDLPRSVSLLELNGPELASSPEAVIERWRENWSIVSGPAAPATRVQRAGTLRAVVGQSAGEPLALDLRSDGPHALVGGTTGSGKSELLQAWILAMAAAHSPQRLTFLLVDYKGGSAFRACTDLPHTVGLVTDLSPHMVRRALTSLAAELHHRERLFERHKAKDLVELERRGVADTPPSLVLVVDEFAALVNEVPEFVDGVVNVAQRGRSLGLHLILATQRPAGVIKDNLRANTNLRLALRVADEADSTDVLGSPQAAFFPADVPGRAVSKTGPGRLVPFQTGYAGGHTSDVLPPPEILVEELAFGPGAVWAVERHDDTDIAPQAPTDIDRLVASVRRASDLAGIEAPRKPWLPELRAVYNLADQEQVPSRRRDDELVFGVRDDPEHQAQPTVAFHPDRDGNLAVYGTGGSGKSTLLRTIAIAAGFTVRGGPCHVYGLDFGSRGLDMLEELPHVGSIIAGSDHERLTRLLSWLRGVVDDRALAFARAKAGSITEYRDLSGDPSTPRIMVLVDGIAAFRQAYEVGDRARYLEMLTSIASDGRPVGVHVILSGDRPAALPSALAAAVQQKLVLRVADPGDYLTLNVPSDILDQGSPPGRGIMNGGEVQVAMLGSDPNVTAQTLAVAGFAEAMRQAGVADVPAIGRLTDRVFLEALPPVAAGLPTLGVGAESLEAVGFDPRGTFIVSGPPGAGRSSALLTVASSFRRTKGAAAKLFYFGNRRSPLADADVWNAAARGADEVATRAAALAGELALSAGALPPVAVFIENIAEFVGTAAEGPLQDLVKVLLAEDRLVVVEGETTTLAGSFGLIGSVKSSRAGLALSPDPADGPGIFRTAFPHRLNRADFPPGRGFLVGGGTVTLLQTALAG